VTLDAHYVDPRLARFYDAECGWGADRDWYLALAGDPPLRIFDLGCGTGLLTVALALHGHRVTGADPAAPMLDLARARPGGDSVKWVRSDAQTFASADRFDLIIMTGHAFQTLLTPGTIAATLSMMRRHLSDQGRAVIETRNPALNWAALWDGSATILPLPDGPVRITRRVTHRTPHRIRFVTTYDDGTGPLTSDSTLNFPSLTALQAALTTAGLTTKSVLGDWNGSAFDPAQSPEIILTAQRDQR
jgi:ubiquinone/menaquinone biosynthesis C-methylase UbiE